MKNNSSLPLMEMFPTIQGEGHHQGKAAFFVRLGGCDVGCSWCDVKESWDMNAHPSVPISEMVKEALKYSARTVVITGGEPAMHNLTELTKQFREAGFVVHIETSGSHPLTGEWDWVTLSPKKFKAALPEYFSQLDELKVIVVNSSDYKWAEKMASYVDKKGVEYYLQPEWDKSHKVMPGIVDFIKANPEWKVSLQIHKFMDIP